MAWPSASVAIATTQDAADSPGDGAVIRVPRPEPPYRVWFQPRLFIRDVDLYRNMTIDASGWIDPRIAYAFGKTTLNWVYGPNHPWATGPESWVESLDPSQLTSDAAALRGVEGGTLKTAGVAIDEWVPPAKEQNPEWLAEGLREARQKDPSLFIAVWMTDPYGPLFDLVREETVDLLLIEGYTHSVEPGLSTSWEGALRRCELVAEAGLLDKTVFSFGHITDRPNPNGETLQPSWIEKKAVELKDRYPAMPGVAFFQSTDPETPELRELVRFCDRLSGELWPEPLPSS